MPSKEPRLWAVVPEQYVKAADELVMSGLYMTRGSLVRAALRRLFKDQGIHPFYTEAED